MKSVLHSSLPILAFGVLTALAVTPSGRAAETAPVHSTPKNSDALWTALATLKEEPPALLLIEDVQKTWAALKRTTPGQIWLDDRFSEGRSEILNKWSTLAGFEMGAFWKEILGNLEGPLLMGITSKPSGTEAQPRWVPILVLGSADPNTARILWETAKKRAPWLNDVHLTIQKHGEAKPSTDAINPSIRQSPWARNFLEQPGLFKAHLRPQVLADQESHAKKSSSRLIQQIVQSIGIFYGLDIQSLKWSIDPDGTEFVERMSLQLAAKPKTTFVKIAQTFGQGAATWPHLGGALPEGQDAAILMNAQMDKLGPMLPSGFQVLERILRGKKWTRRHGASQEALDAGRFSFLSETFSGRMGITGRLALSGEANLIAAGATYSRSAAEVRAGLSKNLAKIGAPFENLESAAPIGAQLPLAAAFKGRSFLPAPVIGLSKGWAWLCSSPSAYQKLTGAFVHHKTLNQDATLGAVKRTKSPGGLEPLATESFSIRVNLPRILPLVYTAWLLSDKGPIIGQWSVPLGILPQPNLFAKRLRQFHAGLSREGDTISTFSRGPLPGGAALPLAVLVNAAKTLDRHEKQRAADLHRQLELLNTAGSSPDQAPTAPVIPESTEPLNKDKERGNP